MVVCRRAPGADQQPRLSCRPDQPPDPAHGRAAHLLVGPGGGQEPPCGHLQVPGVVPTLHQKHIVAIVNITSRYRTYFLAFRYLLIHIQVGACFFNFVLMYRYLLIHFHLQVGRWCRSLFHFWVNIRIYLQSTRQVHILVHDKVPY